MNSGNTIILGEINQLRAASQAIQQNIEQIVSGFRDIADSAKSVSLAAEKTVKNIDNMESAVGSFKT